MLSIIFSMKTLWVLMIILYIPVCIGLIAVVLLQKGKGVGFAGAFGVGGGSDTLFGARSARSLPQKLTYIGAALFMILAMTLSTVSGKVGKGAAPALVDEKAPVESAAMDDLFGGAKEGEANAAPATTPATPAPAAEAPAAPAPAPAADAPATPAPAAETPVAPATPAQQ